MVGRQQTLLYLARGYAIALLKVESDIPYLIKGTGSTAVTGDDTDDVEKVLASVGLIRWYGKLALNLDVTVPQLDAATPAKSGGILVDEQGVAPPAAKHKVKRPTRWKSDHKLCNVCGPGRGKCLWYSEKEIDETEVCLPSSAEAEMAPDSGGAAGSGEPKIAEEKETPMCDADEEQPGRLSLAEEAHSEAHMRSHKPFKTNIATCVSEQSPKTKEHIRKLSSGSLTTLDR